MPGQDPWPLIHAERAALLADVGDLTPTQWATRSLCPDWTTRDVLAHITETALMTRPRFFAKLAGAGFKFHDMTAAGVSAHRDEPIDQLIGALTDRATATTQPPGPIDAMVGEAVVHSEDIRRPLGLHRDYPTATVIRAADFYAGSNLLIGAKSRIAGLTLRATDAEWSHGAGPEVSGPAIALLLAMTGRPLAEGELSGPGTEALLSRA